MACLGGITLTALLEGCASTNYFAQNTTSGKQITIRKTEFIKVEKEKQVQRKYVLVKPENLNFPICIYRLEDGSYVALPMQCTHKGCELQPNGDYLICPCHGSEFSNKGIVKNPPAEENLKPLKITTDDENIYIQP